MTYETSKGNKNKNMIQNQKKDKYAQMKLCPHDRKIQFYMYHFIYFGLRPW